MDWSKHGSTYWILKIIISTFYLLVGCEQFKNVEKDFRFISHQGKCIFCQKNLQKHKKAQV